MKPLCENLTTLSSFCTVPPRTQPHCGGLRSSPGACSGGSKCQCFRPVTPQSRPQQRLARQRNPRSTPRPRGVPRSHSLSGRRLVWSRLVRERPDRSPLYCRRRRPRQSLMSAAETNVPSGAVRTRVPARLTQLVTGAIRTPSKGRTEVSNPLETERQTRVVFGVCVSKCPMLSTACLKVSVHLSKMAAKTKTLTSRSKESRDHVLRVHGKVNDVEQLQIVDRTGHPVPGSRLWKACKTYIQLSVSSVLLSKSSSLGSISDLRFCAAKGIFGRFTQRVKMAAGR